jgi:hypothetical protein
MGAELGRVFSDYRTLVETCRARADELELSRLEIDRLSGLPAGYAGKLLGKDGGDPGRKHKKMWPIALESMLGVLGLKILLIEDDAATARAPHAGRPRQSALWQCFAAHAKTVAAAFSAIIATAAHSRCRQATRQ